MNKAAGVAFAEAWPALSALDVHDPFEEISVIHIGATYVAQFDLCVHFFDATLVCTEGPESARSFCIERIVCVAEHPKLRYVKAADVGDRIRQLDGIQRIRVVEIQRTVANQLLLSPQCSAFQRALLDVGNLQLLSQELRHVTVWNRGGPGEPYCALVSEDGARCLPLFGFARLKGEAAAKVIIPVKQAIPPSTAALRELPLTSSRLQTMQQRLTRDQERWAVNRSTLADEVEEAKTILERRDKAISDGRRRQFAVEAACEERLVEAHASVVLPPAAPPNPPHMEHAQSSPVVRSPLSRPRDRWRDSEVAGFVTANSPVRSPVYYADDTRRSLLGSADGRSPHPRHVTTQLNDLMAEAQPTSQRTTSPETAAQFNLLRHVVEAGGRDGVGVRPLANHHITRPS